MSHERRYYEPIRTALENLIQQAWDDEEVQVRIEVAERGVSRLLQSWIHDDIREQHLKQKPDIAGAVYSEDMEQVWTTVVGEIKSEDVRIQDLYQAIRYSDLYDADPTFLITTGFLREDLENFFKDRVAPVENRLWPYYQRGLILMEFDPSIETFTSWLMARSGPIHIVESLKAE